VPARCPEQLSERSRDRETLMDVQAQIGPSFMTLTDLPPDINLMSPSSVDFISLTVEYFLFLSGCKDRV